MYTNYFHNNAHKQSLTILILLIVGVKKYDQTKKIGKKLFSRKYLSVIL